MKYINHININFKSKPLYLTKYNISVGEIDKRPLHMRTDNARRLLFRKYLILIEHLSQLISRELTSFINICA